MGLSDSANRERQKAGSGVRVLVPHLGRTGRQELPVGALAKGSGKEGMGVCKRTSFTLLLQGRQGQDLPLPTECLPLQDQTLKEATTSFTDGALSFWPKVGCYIIKSPSQSPLALYKGFGRILQIPPTHTPPSIVLGSGSLPLPLLLCDHLK